MLFGMEEPELETFVARIAATSIVNQAAIKCIKNHVPLTGDNIVLLVGDFIDPAKEGTGVLVSAILNAIEEISAIGRPISRDLDS